MATNLELANRAIRATGGQPITDLAATSATAKIVNDALLPSIEEVLTEYQWHINTVTESSIGSTGDIPDTEFRYNHDLTALTHTLDRIVKLVTADGYPIHNFRIEGQDLYADYETLFVVYTYPIEDVATFPPYLVQVVAAHLAKEICIPLTGSEDRRGRLEEKYMRVLAQAKTQASRQNPQQSFLSDDSSVFIQARSTGSRFYEGTNADWEV